MFHTSSRGFNFGVLAEISNKNILKIPQPILKCGVGPSNVNTGPIEYYFVVRKEKPGGNHKLHLNGKMCGMVDAVFDSMSQVVVRSSIL